MGTSAYIYIKLEESDKNKFLKADKNKLHSYEDWNNDTPKFKVKNDATYMGIYCHYDGYLNEGVGDTLLKHYDTKEKVMNLIACGYCSGIVPNVASYYALGEPTKKYWKEICPDFNNDMCWRGNYTYLFDNGEWYLVEGTEKKLTPLKKIL